MQAGTPAHLSDNTYIYWVAPNIIARFTMFFFPFLGDDPIHIRLIQLMDVTMSNYGWLFSLKMPDA